MYHILILPHYTWMRNYLHKKKNLYFNQTFVSIISLVQIKHGEYNNLVFHFTFGNPLQSMSTMGGIFYKQCCIV